MWFYILVLEFSLFYKFVMEKKVYQVGGAVIVPISIHLCRCICPPKKKDLDFSANTKYKTWLKKQV